MLTVDTHFPDGYRCEECESQYDMNYSNVIACSSRQISDLIAWIQQQPFYENTTIVLCGDHLTFDAEFASEKISEQYDRRMYFTIINSAKEETGDKQRVFTSVDMYPTTLSAMGVEIPGNCLGLGVDLFSDCETLAEKYGLEEFGDQLLRDSELYRKKLMYGK